MEQNLNPTTSIRENDRVRVMNTLLKENLLVIFKQLAVLLKRNFYYALFSENFQVNLSSKFLLEARSERVC